MQMPEERCMLVPAVGMDYKYYSILLLKVKKVEVEFIILYSTICIYDNFHSSMCRNTLIDELERQVIVGVLSFI
jgi:hypothetical protein